jgi:DUF971 family protein
MQPSHIEAIGHEIAIRWSDGTETFHPMEQLRAASPSAENTGEQDLLGRRFGGSQQKVFPGVTVTGWRLIGSYAIQFDFSDGHNTGLFGYQMLRQLAAAASC